MSSIKKFFLIFFGVAILSLFAWATARADGGYFPSKTEQDVYMDVYMPEQLAIVYFKDGREDLIIQVQYQRARADDFGWIVPLPSVPEIDTESQGLAGIFTELSRLTTDDLPSSFPWERGGGGGYDGGGGGGGGNGGVTVVQHELVGIYEVTVLVASSAEDLVVWLTDNNYAVPEGSEPVFQDYIDRGWCFVCMRLESSKDLSGSLHPLRVSFPSDLPVYPMRLTEFSSGLTELLMYVLTEDEQTFSRAIKEWGYYVSKATLYPSYPLLFNLVGGDIFITKIRAYFSTQIQPFLTRGYDDITLMNAEARTWVEVWPYSGKITEGYTHVFRARGGTPPYTWTCSDDAVGEIDAGTGAFIAVGPGWCSVIAEDAEGNRGSSGAIIVGERDSDGCFIATAASDLLRQRSWLP
jgi:hypothetical protein